MKSDIEIILESQTWKNLKRPKKKTKTSILIPEKPKPLLSISEVSPVELTEIPQSLLKHKGPKKSFLAIRLASISSNIANILKNDETNIYRIPTFPKSPFGIHSKSAAGLPTFKILYNTKELNTETINSIKYESGRIKKLISKSFASPSAGLHKKSSQLNRRLCSVIT